MVLEASVHDWLPCYCFGPLAVQLRWQERVTEEACTSWWLEVKEEKRPGPTVPSGAHPRT